MPKAEDLPDGWRKSGEDFVGWKDAAAAIEAAGPMACGATQQEAAKRYGSVYMVANSPGNGAQDGADFTLQVLMDSTRPSANRTAQERVELVERNMTAGLELWDCFGPAKSGIGDGSLSFANKRFANVVMRVGPVEVLIHTPLDGAGPTAEAWARVLEQRIRSVMSGHTPTARISAH
ncbi:hypothetical protein [Streptomyces sp. NPDC090445]|uniref:hypothetical protein n=1 Tax=Streptomyces sp. NPDC090445 TaxID=3365963 RepID=UPI0038243783